MNQKLTPQQMRQEYGKAEKEVTHSVAQLNDASENVRKGKITTFVTLAQYSAGTVTVMFTFLGVVLGLKSQLSYESKVLFMTSSVLFVACILLSITLRALTHYYVFYMHNTPYLRDRQRLFKVQADIITTYPETVIVNSKSEEEGAGIILQKSVKDLTTAQQKVEKELTKSTARTRIYERIFRFGGYIDYSLFVAGYLILAIFMINILQSL